MVAFERLALREGTAFRNWSTLRRNRLSFLIKGIELRSRNSHFLTPTVTKKNKMAKSRFRNRRHRRKHPLVVLVIIMTLCLPYLFMLVDVGPNVDSPGEATIDIAFCVADPFFVDLVHPASKTICSHHHSEGRAGAHSPYGCKDEWGRSVVDNCSKGFHEMAICPPPLGCDVNLGQDGGHVVNGSRFTFACPSRWPFFGPGLDWQPVSKSTVQAICPSPPWILQCPWASRRP